MDVVGFIKRFSSGTIWLASVLLSALMSEAILVPMSLLLKGKIDIDFLVTGLATSLVVASLIAAVLVYLLDMFRKNDARLHHVEAETLAEKNELRQSLWRHANYDALTELPNRKLFGHRLKREIRKASRSGDLLAVMYLDVGHLKEVNDALGHRLGDKLLTDAAKRISDRIRGADIVARLGGDEFALILTKLAEAGHVERIAHDLLESLRQPYHLGKEMAYLFPSIGIAVYPNDAADVEGLMMGAGQALNRVKSDGGNSFGYVSKVSQDGHLKRLRMIQELHVALSEKQFQLFFQPVTDLKTGAILKAEALIRWRHPERGLVTPLEFIPLAEETGLIHDIGDWVFREALKYGKRWSELTGRTFKIGVNMSPVQFKMKSLGDQWLQHLQQAGLTGENVMVEITEGVLMYDGQGVEQLLLSFRDAAIEVAIDDFGTGYSSLSYLKKYHVDYLKIDQSFVRNIPHDASDLALSEAIITMAHKLDMKVIAEGIETAEQRDTLAAAGCDFGQGYLFSKPLPPENFELLLAGDAAAVARAT